MSVPNPKREQVHHLYQHCPQKYGRPLLPWSIKAQLQGRPSPAASKILQKWAQLPVPQDVYYAEVKELQKKHFWDSKPLLSFQRCEPWTRLANVGSEVLIAQPAFKGHLFRISLDTLEYLAHWRTGSVFNVLLIAVYPGGRFAANDAVMRIDIEACLVDTVETFCTSGFSIIASVMRIVTMDMGLNCFPAVAAAQRLLPKSQNR
ncbi:hypothetical protein BDZ45DRAFT_750490 [Acephala macrosclerotiorum]|nr:hypothetical protein BDZ45DRAFT_750490 [Acephala macrosclerotiorum]